MLASCSILLLKVPYGKVRYNTVPYDVRARGLHKIEDSQIFVISIPEWMFNINVGKKNADYVHAHS